MNRTRLVAVSLLALTLPLTACSKEEPAKAASSEQASDLKLPEPKAYEPTPEAKLGTREDGLGVAPGTKAPDFTAQTTEGEEVTLSQLNERGPLLLVFYRGGWCPYCNAQVHRFTKAYPRFEEAGVLPVFISSDEVDAAVMTEEHYTIPFPVLADPDLHAIEAFDVAFQMDDATVEKLKGFQIDTEAWSQRQHQTIAVPSVFLVDGDGTVRWAHVSRDYKSRPSVDELLGVVEETL
ncbi:MAG: peroxiredoxin family protein [Myxococcota bacterium]